MKKLYKNIATALAIILTVFGGCKNPADDVQINITTSSLFKAPVLVHFSNANKASTSISQDFKVTISGKDAPFVQMGAGGNDFKAIKGYLSLALTNAAMPSEANPISFNIYAEIPGYAPVNQVITITKESALSFEVSALELANPVKGTSVLTIQTNLVNGATNVNVALNTVANANLPETASIDIPQSTQMQDVNGAPINSDQLKSTIIMYSGRATNIATIFPGGLNPKYVLDINGKPIVGGLTFIPASTIMINMTAGSTAVMKFSKPLEVTQEIEPGFTNYNTGKALQVGETVPLWSMNEKTGQWKAEGNAVVSLKSNGKLVFKYSINHLSIYHVGYYYSFQENSTVKQFDVNLIPASKPFYGLYDIDIYDQATGTIIGGFKNYIAEISYFQKITVSTTGATIKTTVVGNKYGFSWPYVPNVKAAIARVYDIKGNKVAESQVFNPVLENSININITNKVPQEIVLLGTDLTLQCKDKDLKSPLNGWVSISDLDDDFYSINAYVKNGAIYDPNSLLNTIGQAITGLRPEQLHPGAYLVVGHTYQVYMRTNETSYSSKNFKIVKESFKIPGQSSDIDIEGEYYTDGSGGTGSMHIKGSILIKCN